MTKYLERENLSFAFSLVHKHYAVREQVPVYEHEAQGCEQLLATFEAVKNDAYYSDIYEKAAYIFININKGHFFSNGNKRLALVCAIGFLAINDKKFRKESQEWYQNLLQELFPKYQDYEQDHEFDPAEFALYNLSLIVAESHHYVEGDFDALKQKVKQFFAETTTENVE